MFHSIQCSMSSAPFPVAASTSCTTSAKLPTPSGTLVHASGGDTWSPPCEYLAGIDPPSAHALVVSVITCTPPRPPPRPPGGGCPPDGGAGGAPRCWAKANVE